MSVYQQTLVQSVNKLDLVQNVNKLNLVSCWHSATNLSCFVLTIRYYPPPTLPPQGPLYTVQIRPPPMVLQELCCSPVATANNSHPYLDITGAICTHSHQKSICMHHNTVFTSSMMSSWKKWAISALWLIVGLLLQFAPPPMWIYSATLMSHHSASHHNASAFYSNNLHL